MSTNARIFHRIAEAIVLSVTLAACSTIGLGKSGATARIKSLDGNVAIARGNGNWEPAHLWETMHSGDRARTEAHGIVDFSLGKFGGVLTLMPESTIVFEQLGPAGPGLQIVAVISLLEGRVVGDTLKLPPNTRIQIKTADGVHEIP
jgi:hypothetical protein